MSHLSALIPITYELAAIIGSVFIGYLFRSFTDKYILLLPFMTVLFICFILLRFLSVGVWEHFLIIGIVGFSLGGTFNTLAGLVVM